MGGVLLYSRAWLHHIAGHCYEIFHGASFLGVIAPGRKGVKRWLKFDTPSAIERDRAIVGIEVILEDGCEGNCS